MFLYHLPANADAGTLMDKFNAMVKAIAKPTLVISILLTGIGGSLCLKAIQDLSEASFMVLLTLSSIFSILLPNLNQLKSFSITKGELILQEVKDSEAAVRELAIATVDLVEASNEFALVTEEFDQDRYDKAVDKVRNLTREKHNKWFKPFAALTGTG